MNSTSFTWLFQHDFIPRAKPTKAGSYSIISDYLGTTVEAYDDKGEKVWERELNIYGRVKSSRKDRFGSRIELVGEDGFIPFRYQGQYEDVETGLYYNRFRYYDLEIGQYTQHDPTGLAGGNLTIYAYVSDLNLWIDPFGLNKVIHFPDFDAALRKAYGIAMGGDPNVAFTATNFDPKTGTYVGFKGSNGSKIVFDSPHADMKAKLGHDKPHIGANEAGKRLSGAKDII